MGEARYTPDGEMRQDEPRGVIPTDLLYTRQRWDSALGLYDDRARSYDLALCRFLQSDSLVQTDSKDPAPYLPLTVSYADPRIPAQRNQIQRASLRPEARVPNTASAFDPPFLNRYAYVRNNPLAYVDDTGHIAWWVMGGVVCGVTGFGVYVLIHRDRFDWREAVPWAGGGAVVGATLGAGDSWAVGALTVSPWALLALQRRQAIHRIRGQIDPPISR